MMVNDIRPEASALLRQIASITQKKAGSIGNKQHNNIMSRESRVRSLESSVKSGADVYHAKPVQLTYNKELSTKGGVSVVEDVFNQIYSKSGFLEEQEVVPAKVEQLGTRLDVYA